MAHKIYSDKFQMWMVSFALMLGLFFCTGYTGYGTRDAIIAVQVTARHTNHSNTAGYAGSYGSVAIVATLPIIPNNAAAHKASLVNYNRLSKIKIAVTQSLLKAIVAACRFARIQPITANSGMPPCSC